MYSEHSSGIKLIAHSCICWIFHRIYYDARNHKHKVIRYAQKVSAKWPLMADTARVYMFTELCWNSRRHVTLNRRKDYGHTEHVQKHSSDIHIKSVNHYFHGHNKITDKRPVTTGRPTASYLNLSLCCGVKTLISRSEYNVNTVSLSSELHCLITGEHYSILLWNHGC